MPAFTAPKPLALRLLTDAGADHARLPGAHALLLHHDSSAPHTVIVAVRGEIDASNARDMSVYLRDNVGSYRGLVLDLRRVTFFGLEGISALQVISEAQLPFSRTALVPSPAVTRLLRLCPLGARSLLCDDVAAALVAVQTHD